MGAQYGPRDRGYEGRTNDGPGIRTRTCAGRARGCLVARRRRCPPPLPCVGIPSLARGMWPRFVLAGVREPIAHAEGTLAAARVPEARYIGRQARARRMTVHRSWSRTQTVEARVAPTRRVFWAQADKPWQFLVACREWSWRAESGFVSRLPIALDVSASVLQHLSVLARDRAGAATAKLINGAAPQTATRKWPMRSGRSSREVTRERRPGRDWSAAVWSSGA